MKLLCMRLYLMVLNAVNLVAFYTIARRANWRYRLVDYKFNIRRAVDLMYNHKPILSYDDDVPF